MLTDQEIIDAWRNAGGHCGRAAKLLDISERAMFKRRKSIEARLGIQLPAGAHATNHRGDAGQEPNAYLQRLPIDGFEGRMVVFSDAHFHPGISRTLAFRALLEIIRDLKPKLVVAGGDVFDGARVSRYPRDGWHNLPRMSDELDEVKERMAEIRAAYRSARHIRVIGNHDIRFDRYLANNASEAEGIAGFRLADHLSEWQECVSVFINNNTMVKHRFGNGQHAAYMATLKAGTNTFSGHTHRLQTTPWGDYHGRRYGSETGALADLAGPQFLYAEDAPSPACSGFMVATYTREGQLLYPEPCEVRREGAIFRGQVVIRNSERASKNVRLAA